MSIAINLLSVVMYRASVIRQRLLFDGKPVLDAILPKRAVVDLAGVELHRNGELDSNGPYAKRLIIEQIRACPIRPLIS